MKRHKRFFWGLMLFAIVAFTWGGITESVDAAKITLKFGHVLQTDHPYHKMALKFKNELERRNKEVVVNIFPAKLPLAFNTLTPSHASTATGSGVRQPHSSLSHKIQCQEPSLF